jgi:hypothetical protein
VRTFFRVSLPLVLLLVTGQTLRAAERPEIVESSGTRIASVALSEDIINELLKQNLKSELLRNVSVDLDPVKQQILMHGLLRIPTEDLQAVNLEPGLGDFNFQLAIKLKATRHGHLLLIFPLDQTFFYPASSQHPDRDRVVIPVQFISLALASARGYLALLSGDFSSLERKSRTLKTQIDAIDQQLLTGKEDAQERAVLEANRKALEAALQAIPAERQQAEAMSKKLSGVLGFVGGNEINLNEELSARRNALFLKIKLEQFVPYLQDVELGGVRLFKDERDGSGEDFMAIDINAQIPGIPAAESPPRHGINHGPPQKPPSVIIRLNQALFESQTILGLEHQDIDNHIKKFSMQMTEDGMQAGGAWRIPILPNIPFSTVIDFDWVAPDVFEMRVRSVDIAHIDFKILTGLVLEAAKKRLDAALKGKCTFTYIGEEADHSRAIRVTLDMPSLLPAFPKMRLTGVRVKNKELILKAGEL